MNFWEYEITSDYGKRYDPFTGKTSKHKGIDYALPLGTEVIANVSGEVVKTGYEANGYGNYVVVEGKGEKHYYAHLQSINVREGDTVNSSETVLGKSGTSGRSTGPHLHYEVRDVFNNERNPHNFSDLFFTSDTSDASDTNATDTTVSDTTEPDNNVAWYDVKGKIKNVVYHIFKFIIIAILIILFVVFITKSMDLNII